MENKEYLYYLIEEYLIDDFISEVRGKKKTVIRGGVRKKRYFCPKGYRATSTGECKKITSSEKIKMKRAAKKAAKKRRTKKSSSIKKRQRSLKKRTWK